MLLTATKEMIPEIKKLWKLGFGDGSNYIDFVFDNLISPEKVLVYMDNSKEIVGMMCLEPFSLESGNNSAKAIYMYAFTVHPEHRNKKLGAVMLQGLDDYCKKNKYIASILTPAEKSLFGYYEKTGYKTQFAVRQLTYRGEFFVPTNRSCILIPRSLNSLYKLRNDFFSSSKLYVNWSPNYLKFVSDETKLRDGEVLFAQVRDKKGYLVYRLEDNEAIITEFAIPHDCMDDVLFTLHRRIKAEKYKIRAAADYLSKDKEIVLPFSMIKWYDKFTLNSSLIGAPYINHVMD